MNSLTFNAIELNPIPQNDSQIWLSSSELANALGYKSTDSVSRIFDRNSDEFTNGMTLTVNLTVSNKKNELQEVRTRIFSLRGCHLIAMFARTSVAKEFRKWVLDILDKHVGTSVCKTHKSDREPLNNAVNMLVAKTKHLNYSDAYKLVHQRFNVKSIDGIPFDTIPVAVEYVHHLIALYRNAEQSQFSKGDQINLHTLATHMIWVREWWRTFGDAVRVISPTMAAAVHDHFVDGSCVAWSFIDKDKKDDLKHAIKDYEWLLPYDQRRQYLVR